MSTSIVVNSLTRQPDATNEVITLDVFLKDSDFVGTYDQLQVWRSTTGSSGIYEELTAGEVSAALLPSTGGLPSAQPGPDVVISGKELLVGIGRSVGSVFQLTLSGTDPQSTADVAAQINTAPGNIYFTAYVDGAGKLVLKTVAVGQTAGIQASGDAAVILGLPSTQSVGREIRLSLVPGVARYYFTDLFGSSKYYYKTRFYNSSTGAVGEFSQPYAAITRVVVDPTTTIRGYVELVRVDGKPLVGQYVRIHATFNGSLINNKTLVGSDLIQATDAFGRVEFSLARGHKVTVSIPGTDIYRSITVPSDPELESFNLLDPSIADEDVFKAAVPEIIIAERRSLE